MSKQLRHFENSTNVLVKISVTRFSPGAGSVQYEPPPLRPSALPPSMAPHYLVQITTFPESKFPLDQCSACIAAVWRLAQPRFPKWA